MKVTPRQKQILDQLFDLYHYNEWKPVHYSVVADKLGISKWTAYDLLKVLEEKGFVQSNYEVAEEVKGRGRSSVLFSPTDKATELIERLTDGALSRGEWGKTKQSIMDKIEHLDEVEHQQLLKKILKMLPKE
ncbi:MAG: hypothetical protein JW782_00310 [Candidatus Saganbacteria bacterium]|nr:hypothetical protein [Candidatus Saganbacteria bacterium]